MPLSMASDREPSIPRKSRGRFPQGFSTAPKCHAVWSVPPIDDRWQTGLVAVPVDHELAGSARAIDRALRLVEDGARSLRQKLLARRLAHTLPSDEWTPAATEEAGLSADDLRRRAAEIRSRRDG